MYVQAMPTLKYPGVVEVRFCSEVSASQVCKDRMTEALTIDVSLVLCEDSPKTSRSYTYQPIILVHGSAFTAASLLFHKKLTMLTCCE